MSPDYARMAVVVTLMVSGFAVLWQQHESASKDQLSRIERLEQGKADRVDSTDHWRRSEEMEYQKRIDSEIATIRKEVDDLRRCSNPCRRKP